MDSCCSTGWVVKFQLPPTGWVLDDSYAALGQFIHAPFHRANHPTWLVNCLAVDLKYGGFADAGAATAATAEREIGHQGGPSVRVPQ